MTYHQINADISLPSSADLLEKALPESQLLAIYELVGQQELIRIASVVHGKEANPDYKSLAEQEGKDLEILFSVIKTVTGKSRPWIIGFASDFASGLLNCVHGTDITFSEFENACAEDGHPLYKPFQAEDLKQFRELVFHSLSIKVHPMELYPAETLGDTNDSNVARLPRKTWHGYYAEILGSVI